MVYAGSDDGILYALNAATGAFQWKYKTEGWIESSPMVENGVVYVGSRDTDVCTILYTIDATMGNLLWKYSTNEYFAKGFAAADGVVYRRDYALNAAT